MKRAFIMVLDSFGIGASADAEKFGDTGSDTLGHIAKACLDGQADSGRVGPLHLPNLTRLGLAKAAELATGKIPAGMDADVEICGAYASASELSSGKDTPSGHWEIAGVPVLFEWGYFTNKQNSFPTDLLNQLVEQAGLPGYLGNCHASGTVILDELGEQHIQTGKPIFYTSADSVFQIACHEDTFGLERLYELCEIARKLLNEGQYNIGRVIARPFIGKTAGEFERTGNRHDLAVEPPSPTMLLKLVEEKKGNVIAVGKIADIYAQQGITQHVKATGLDALFDASIQQMQAAPNNTIVFTNFVDFDSSWGHRRDVAGYARGLELFDRRLPELLACVQDGDILILTADHGCDPTWPGTEHTREQVPVLIYGSSVTPGSLGRRDTFADIGQTIADYFALSPMEYGTSLLA